MKSAALRPINLIWHGSTRKLLVLKRLGDALGRPVEDFYGDKAEHDATWRKVDDNG